MSNKKKVNSAETENSANQDKYVGNIPLKLLEAKMFKTSVGELLIPAYKVRNYHKEDSEPLWFVGGRISAEDGVSDEEMLRREKTFIYGSLPTLWEMLEKGEYNDEYEFIIMTKQETCSVDLTNENVYVGIDVFSTNEGLKYCISGSNWFYGQTEDGKTMLKIDEISYDLMFNEKVA